MNKEQKTVEQIELRCADCGLPIAGERPRTDVTRYLSDISRCSCNRDGSSKASDSAKSEQVSMVSLEAASDILGERFEVLSFLGQGGMGAVFKVHDHTLGKIVAVKILNPRLMHDQQSIKRFEQEAKAAIALTHPHLAAVYEYGIGKNNTPFLVMDYLEGTTLDELLKSENTLDYKRAIDIFIQLCEAAHYAHSKGVVHRDIKPSNIIVMRLNRKTDTEQKLDVDGSKRTNLGTDAGIEFAKLFDFGIAKVLPNQAIDFTQDMTQTGELFGSPLYMSPEQCKGLPVDGRSDIHALGCVIYKALTGVHPYEGKNFVDTVVKVITQEAPPFAKTRTPTAFGVKPPAVLEQVVLHCLNKSPSDRYSNADLLKLDLEKIRDGKPISLSPKKKKKRKTNQTFVVAGVAVATILSLFVIVPNALNGPARHTPANVTTEPYSDAQQLDAMAFSYFSKGDYQRAIPLLEFGVNTYKKNGSTKTGMGREDNYLAENLSHIGKCYLMLKQYDKAAPYYKDSLKIFQQWGNYKGGMMAEAVNEYADTLRNLGRGSEADAMLAEFRKYNNIRNLP